MSKAQAELLNLELAWKRVKLDIADRVCTRNPFAVKLIENNLAVYLNELNERICNDTYNPKPANHMQCTKRLLVRTSRIDSIG